MWLLIKQTAHLYGLRARGWRWKLNKKEWDKETQKESKISESAKLDFSSAVPPAGPPSQIQQALGVFLTFLFL